MDSPSLRTFQVCAAMLSSSRGIGIENRLPWPSLRLVCLLLPLIFGTELLHSLVIQSFSHGCIVLHVVSVSIPEALLHPGHVWGTQLPVKFDNVSDLWAWSKIWVEQCSDITNTLVGISGETLPEGGNLRIY